MKISAILLLVLPIVAFAAVLPRNYYVDTQTTDDQTPTTHDDSSFLDQLKKEYEKIRDEVKHELEQAKDNLGKVETEIKDKVTEVVEGIKSNLHETLEKVKEEIKNEIDQAKKDLEKLKQLGQSKYEEMKAKVQDIVQNLVDFRFDDVEFFFG